MPSAPSVAPDPAPDPVADPVPAPGAPRRSASSVLAARDRGSAAAEFALLAGLVSLVLVAAVQLAFALHLRNTATAHVIEGARHGARADLGPADGAARARDLLEDSLAGARGVEVSASRTHVEGGSVVEVRATMTLPVLGPFGPGGAMEVSGHAFAEDQ